MANYFRFLIPKFSQLAAPLTALTARSAEWKEGPLPELAKQAYEEIKAHLISAPVVQYPR